MKNILIQYTSPLGDDIILGTNKEVKAIVLPKIEANIKNSHPSPYREELKTMKQAFTNVTAEYIQYRGTKYNQILLSVLNKNEMKKTLESLTDQF